MVMSLPTIRRPKRSALPKPPDIAQWGQRIKLPDLPDRAEIAARVRLPELPDLPTLPDMPDLSDLPQRLRLPGRKDAAERATRTRAWATIVALALIGVAAAAAYFLDPERGMARRAETVNRVIAAGQRARRRVNRWARSTTWTATPPGDVPDGTADPERLSTPGQPPIGEMASPNGSADEFMPASPGL